MATKVKTEAETETPCTNPLILHTMLEKGHPVGRNHTHKGSCSVFSETHFLSDILRNYRTFTTSPLFFPLNIYSKNCCCAIAKVSQLLQLCTLSHQLVTSIRTSYGFYLNIKVERRQLPAPHPVQHPGVKILHLPECFKKQKKGKQKESFLPAEPAECVSDL